MRLLGQWTYSRGKYCCREGFTLITVASIDSERQLAVTEVDTPTPQAGEVSIDVAFNGVCGSDLHFVFDPPEPMVGHVLGHEFSGVISAVADDVTDWSRGDRVVVLPIAPCGACRACLDGGDAGVCVNGLMAGPGIGRPGGLAQTVTVPAGMLHRIPDGLDLRDAALTEPLAVAMRGVAHADVGAGDTVVVAGAGPIGLLTVEALRSRGVEQILVIEPNPERRAQAEGLGVAVAAPDEAQAVLSTLPNPSPHAVIECSGHPSAIDQGVDLLGYGGRLVVVGVHSAPASVALLMVSLKEIVIIGSTAYSVRDFDAALAALAAGQINTDALITSVVGLTEASTKIHELHGGSSGDVKVLIAHG